MARKKLPENEWNKAAEQLFIAYHSVFAETQHGRAEFYRLAVDQQLKWIILAKSADVRLTAIGFQLGF